MNWVFGYGSLMWRPGFRPAERRAALLDGYHRNFCRMSFRHRGTPEIPGLIIGLKEGGQCLGIAYRIPDETLEESMAYLDAREGEGYHRVLLPVYILPSSRQLDPGPEDFDELSHQGPHGMRGGEREEVVQTWVYVPIKDHPTYLHNATREQLLQLIAQGRGESGTSYEYLRDMVTEIDRLGLDEPALREVLADVKKHMGLG
ncbi:MAG: gamma-glutamylcyclotransferase [Deltaproteobacteria bacterium]|nr:gamma-glutamylcyclotransferase [Deltaproteobacteria bacterium]